MGDYMKNNKGFTLIELIVTIGVMVLLGIVIVANMSGILSEQKDTDYETFKKKLEDSACIYVETADSSNSLNKTNCRTSGGCEIPVKNLIEKGYIEDTLKDPSNGNYASNYKVKVSWINNVKTCELIS